MGNTLPEPSGLSYTGAGTSPTGDVASPSGRPSPDAPNPSTSSIDNTSAHFLSTKEPDGGHDSADGPNAEGNTADVNLDDGGDDLDAVNKGASVDNQTPEMRKRPEPKQYKISEYELERDDNIARNKLLFQSMGLDEFTKDLATGLRNPGANGKKKKPRATKTRKQTAASTAKTAKASAAKTSKSQSTRTTRAGARNKAPPSRSEDREMINDELAAPSSSSTPTNPAVIPSPAQSTTTPTTLTAGWMIQDREALDRVFVSSLGQEMLDDWVSFEAIKGPQDPKKVKLTKKSRPQPLEDWLGRQRRHDVVPPIGTPLEYGTSWCAWWRSIQPRWRREGPTGSGMALVRRDVEDEAWLNVAKAGANGIVMVLVSLSWWFVAAKEDSDRQWCMDAIEDVAWVLKQLVRRFAKAEEDVVDEEGNARGKKRCVYNSRILIRSF